MESQRLISSDSHVVEPADFWVQRLDRKYRDNAPRVTPNPGGSGLLFMAPGLDPRPVAAGFGIGARGKDFKELQHKGWEAARPSCWDPAERIKDQDIDGVEGEVLYTTLGMGLFQLPDLDLQGACFKVYNDWLAEFCSYDPKRLVGVALIALGDIDSGVKELQRVAKIGFRAALIWGSPPAGRPYTSPEWEPLWRSATELGIPISLHIGTGSKSDGSMAKNYGLVTGGAASVSARPVTPTERFMAMVPEIQRSLTQIIMGGVLERFPGLKLVLAENDIGWIPHYMYRIDHAWSKYSALAADPLPMNPSDYIRRQVFATFQHDPTGMIAYKFFGPDNYMWANDFPHTDSTWPHSRKVISEIFAEIPADVTHKVVFENCRRIYGFE